MKLATLVPIEDRRESVDILWELLGEREPHQSISHNAMPYRDAHEKFVSFHPYRRWYLIKALVPHDYGAAYEIVGAIYLTKADEIGIGIFKRYQGRGFAPKAIELLMKEYGPRRYLANVNPDNAHSIKIFENLGFLHCQNTYELKT